MTKRDDMPALPETPYQLYYEWPDDEDGYGGSEVVDGDAFTADQLYAYAQQHAEQRVREEREACLAEIETGIWFDKTTEEILDSIAAAIRARSKQ